MNARSMLGMSSAARRPPTLSPWRLTLRRLARKRSIILCHHGVGTLPARQDPLSLQVSPQRLRSQLELLDDAGFAFRTVADLLAESEGGAPPPGRFALSFDDGMHDNFTTALPLLRQLGVPASFYITTGIVGAPNPWLAPASAARMMNADELRGMAAAGMELGAHTVTHPDLALLTYDACIEEIGRSREQLQELTGVRATTFAYPFGSFGPEARRAAQDLGFAGAVAANGQGDPTDRHAFPRSIVWGRDRTPTFVAKAADVFEPLFGHPVTRAARGATRGLRRRGRALGGRLG